MPLRFFAIPALAGGEHEAELNRLLAAGKVLALDRQFVADGSASFWAVCVTLGSGDAHWPRTMDQKPRPASAASGAGEPQGARRVGRQGGGPAPTALRAADFGVARA